jgi:hypothetical protein
MIFDNNRGTLKHSFPLRRIKEQQRLFLLELLLIKLSMSETSIEFEVSRLYGHCLEGIFNLHSGILLAEGFIRGSTVAELDQRSTRLKLMLFIRFKSVVEILNVVERAPEVHIIHAASGTVQVLGDVDCRWL